MEWNAIILAGGRSARLGGIDKCAITIGGRRLLDAAIAATEGAASRVIVGPERSRAGSWKQIDFPAPVGRTASTSRPAASPSTTRACNGRSSA